MCGLKLFSAGATLLVLVAFAAARADEARVGGNPAIGESGELDRAHDWLYRQFQRWIRSLDQHFARSEQEAVETPSSTLRINLQASLLHQSDGSVLLGTPDLEATVHLPNIERRLRLFVTSADVQESPANPAEQPSTIRAGTRFALAPALALDLGLHAAFKPSAFATLKWAPQWRSGLLNVTPLAKLYAESNLGYGVSSAIALEHWQHLWIVRSTSYLDAQHSTSGVSGLDWSQTLIAGYAPSIIREQQYGTVASGRDVACGAILRLYAAGDQRARTATREISVVMKRPLRDGWLFGYVEPVIRWDRTSDWHPDVGIRIGFDMLFWDIVARQGGISTSCH